MSMKTYFEKDGSVHDRKKLDPFFFVKITFITDKSLYN
jgi:hypothetical protein